MSRTISFVLKVILIDHKLGFQTRVGQNTNPLTLIPY